MVLRGRGSSGLEGEGQQGEGQQWFGGGEAAVVWRGRGSSGLEGEGQQLFGGGGVACSCLEGEV